jgi:hypothetical protein
MGCRAFNDDNKRNDFLATREKGAVIKTKNNDRFGDLEPWETIYTEHPHSLAGRLTPLKLASLPLPCKCLLGVSGTCLLLSLRPDTEEVETLLRTVLHANSTCTHT